jgi:hypothetical protein
MKKILILFLTASAFLFVKTNGQTSRQKAEAMAAEFSKQKNKEKEKNGIVTEKHKQIEAKPDFRENPASYAGKYEIDAGEHYIVLRYLPANTLEGDYVTIQNDREQKATLKDIKIDAAIVTATIQYEDGKHVPFEGVFINRFENGEKTSGLGARQVLDLSNGMVADKVFYRRVE